MKLVRARCWRSLQTGLAGSILLALTGCGPRFTDANIAVVNKQFVAAEKSLRGGVSPKEVESILGQPKRVQNYTLPLETQKKELNGLRYYYEQDGRELELHFLENRLITPVPELDAKPAIPPTKSAP